MTEQTAPLPPRGWYPDPEVPGHARWWDGAEWQGSVPATAQAQLPIQQQHAELGAGFRARGTGLVMLLATSAVTSAATAALHYWGRTSLADDLEAGRFDSASRYDSLIQAFGWLDMLVLLATAVIWCLWQYRLAKSFPLGVLERSAGMHAGSWFIPIVSLWFPLQNMRNLWDACRPARGRAVLGWWWALWVVGTLVTRWAYSMDMGEDVDSFRDYNTAWLAVSLFWLGAAVLAIWIVATLTHAALTREERQA